MLAVLNTGTSVELIGRINAPCALCAAIVIAATVTANEKRRNFFVQSSICSPRYGRVALLISTYLHFGAVSWFPHPVFLKSGVGVSASGSQQTMLVCRVASCDRADRLQLDVPYRFNPIGRR
jgi:hypothetical protein